MTAKNTFTEQLSEFLLDDDGLTSEQARQDLREEGINLDAYMTDIRATIRLARQAQMRAQAQAERERSTPAAEGVSQKVLSFPIDRVRRIIAEAERGRFGVVGQELAIACRNRQDREPTEAELRALLEDILQTATDVDLYS